MILLDIFSLYTYHIKQTNFELVHPKNPEVDGQFFELKWIITETNTRFIHLYCFII